MHVDGEERKENVYFGLLLLGQTASNHHFLVVIQEISGQGTKSKRLYIRVIATA